MSIPRPDLPADARLETLAVRDGLPASRWGENSEAVYLTSCFVHPDAETAARRFANEEDAFVYSRFSNPNVTIMERRLAALEGMPACIGTGSGMGAILLLFMALLKAGDHVICSQSVFGSTVKLLQSEFGKFGVESSFVSQTDVAQWKTAVKPNTKLLFAETPTNPLTEVCDIQALADVAHEAGALLVVDNKFVPIMRSAGMSLSPFNAWVVAKGMETLSVRLHAQSAATLELARWLEAHPAVERVYYPGLPSHPQHELAMRQQSGIGGAVLAFNVRGGREQAFGVIDATRICSIAANFGDVRTIITHPSSTSHGRLTEAQRQAAGIVQGMIRLGVGLENLDDLKADLARGLDKIAS